MHNVHGIAVGNSPFTMEQTYPVLGHSKLLGHNFLEVLHCVVRLDGLGEVSPRRGGDVNGDWGGGILDATPTRCIPRIAARILHDSFHFCDSEQMEPAHSHHFFTPSTPFCSPPAPVTHARGSLALFSMHWNYPNGH